MAEQTLGGYAFEDDPERMGIPESKKTTASVATYTTAALFQWPATIAGQTIDLVWSLMSDTMYEELRTLYLSDSLLTWIPKPATTSETGKSYQVAAVNLVGSYNDGTHHHQPYRFDVTLSLMLFSESDIAKLTS